MHTKYKGHAFHQASQLQLMKDVPIKGNQSVLDNRYYIERLKRCNSLNAVLQ